MHRETLIIREDKFFKQGLYFEKFVLWCGDGILEKEIILSKLENDKYSKIIIYRLVLQIFDKTKIKYYF